MSPRPLSLSRRRAEAAVITMKGLAASDSQFKPNSAQPETTGPPKSEQWVENTGAVTAGAVLKAAGDYLEEAGRTQWELLRADLKEVALRLMLTIILRSFMRFQPSAHIPNPWPTNLAKLLCMEWTNLAPHFDYCTTHKLLSTPKPYGGGVELIIVHPSLWDCTRRQRRIDAVKLLESISEAIPVEIQLLLRLPPFEIGCRSLSESQNKIGEARPSSTTDEIHQFNPTTDETHQLSPSTTDEIHQFSPPAGPVSFGNPTVPNPATDEIHHPEPPLKDSKSFRGLKLCTSEALKALKETSDRALARCAAAHVISLSKDEKRDFCASLPWIPQQMQPLAKRVRAYVGETTWTDRVGHWTNCIKLDCGAIQAVLNERDNMRKEQRDGEIRDEGMFLFDLARRFSALLYVWYPKPKEPKE